MTVDDDLATVGKFDFEYAGTDHCKIEISAAGLKSVLDSCQRQIGKRVEFAIIHLCYHFPFAGTTNMRRFLTLTVLLVTSALGACGTRGSLYLPPPQSYAPDTPARVSALSLQITPSLTHADLSTAKEHV